MNTILMAPSDSIDGILNIFKSLHTRLQFTMEIDNYGRLNFLDTTIIIENQRIMFDRY